MQKSMLRQACLFTLRMTPPAGCLQWELLKSSHEWCGHLQLPCYGLTGSSIAVYTAMLWRLGWVLK